ncbi:MAG TPA: DUF488 domain-containing protein [Nocardioides sp.]|nr:DUF488 domain-containing protein [Nocardioides sp.]
MRIHTIGFTRTPARTFFELLRESGARRLVDIRLHNVTQLAGFTKRDDLEFFLAELCGMDYTHELRLAPTKPMLDAYQKGTVTWEQYERSFVDLMAERRIEETVPRALLDNSVLLCSEATARHCHRRLVAEYLADDWNDVQIAHL